MLISPMVSAALLTFQTIEMIFFIDVITAAIAIFILLAFLKIPVHAKALLKQKISYFIDMKQGFFYIKEHDYLKKYFIFCAIFYVLVAPAAFLTPLQVKRSFGGDVWRLTAIEIAFSIGMIFGGIIMASWGGFKNKIHTMTLASLLFGFCTFALGIVPVFWIYLFLMGITGIAMPMFNTPSTVLLQEKVEGDFLGRVFGVLTMLSTSMMPLGMLVFGPIADLIKIEWLLVGTGVLLFIQSFFLLGSKSLLKAGRGS
jgi:DHA3 family macrolide efflux protein-like MFS transporter